MTWATTDRFEVKHTRRRNPNGEVVYVPLHWRSVPRDVAIAYVDMKLPVRLVDSTPRKRTK